MSIDVGNEGVADEPVHFDFLPLGDLPRVQPGFGEQGLDLLAQGMVSGVVGVHYH